MAAGSNAVATGTAASVYTAISLPTSPVSPACAIRTDATIECWGLTPPPGTFVAVSVGNSETCAIRTDGTLACWGALITPPDGMFTAVSAGDVGGTGYVCAIRVDGRLACFRAATPPTDTVAQSGNAPEWPVAVLYAAVGALGAWAVLARLRRSGGPNRSP